MPRRRRRSCLWWPWSRKPSSNRLVLRRLAEVSVSPDGERVAFTAEESDPAADEHRTGLYVAPADGSRDPHRLTRASSASSPTWRPDGDTLAFLAARDTDFDRTRGRVDEIDTPLLVTAGEEDWRCPPTQAEQLYVSVRKQGADAKLVIYPNEHHNIGTPERATHRGADGVIRPPRPRGGRRRRRRRGSERRERRRRRVAGGRR